MHVCVYVCVYTYIYKGDAQAVDPHLLRQARFVLEQESRVVIPVVVGRGGAEFEWELSPLGDLLQVCVYMRIYIYICVCIESKRERDRKCERERERARESERERERARESERERERARESERERERARERERERARKRQREKGGRKESSSISPTSVMDKGLKE